ncbi:hypothetical protein [Varibaculum cambriense]|nr:hypothetical protein [Varibaculum cambriense]
MSRFGYENLLMFRRTSTPKWSAPQKNAPSDPKYKPQKAAITAGKDLY